MKQSCLSVYRFICLAIIWLLCSSSVYAQDWIYTVVDGDNLWNLSEQHLDKVTRFEQLRKLNNIENPKRLQPGTRIRVPLAWIRSNPVAAKIISITGIAEIQRARSSTTEPAKVGSLMQLGDQLSTEDDSSVAIEFADKSVLSLHENSLVHFDHLSAHGVTGMVDSRLNLLKGRMDTKVTPAVGPGSRFEIETPSAISAVRGTVYRALVMDNGDKSNIEVLHGKVAVSGANKQLLVNKGYGTQVATGQPPLPPKALLPAPIFEPIPDTITEINWRLAWSEVAGAKAYRVEVATENDFDTLVWEGITEYNRAAFPDLLDGHYAVRVRAIDSLGLEGINQQAMIQLNAQPQPPIALKPVDQQVFREQSPSLQWTAADNAKAYRLEIAADDKFTLPLLDKTLSDSEFDTASLSALGYYYWRLSSIASDGEVGPVGPARSYQIKPIPEKVEAAVSAEESGQLVASWNVGMGQPNYRVQIANDKAFNDIIIDETIDKAEYAFEPFKGDERYLRVKSIEQDGYEGPWGSTQTIQPLPEEPVNYWPLGLWTIFTIILI
ncbi:MAG: LysM motif protein [Methylophaga sp.]|uniref:FecR domain-containing protein n=1 Tax=Methylophaga sp. UBA678 TaxID=1946901 RepID=UPI000C5574C8|nr:FecR domain-containing protein [Methylophaga sp. UBA678]MAX52694.1 LysM motif protein [Methylophaga sp.]|tara:strand:- start:71281 stop:72933 length:1653 start_codon:yes stop_codon:yes gene_type:complete